MDNIIDVNITYDDILDYTENGAVIFRDELQLDITNKRYNYNDIRRKMRINGKNSDRVCMTNDCYTKLCNKCVPGISSFTELKNNIILDDFVFSIRGRESLLYKNIKQSISDAVENIWFMNSSVEEYYIRLKDGVIYKVMPIKDVIVDETVFTFGIMQAIDNKDIYHEHLFLTIPLEKCAETEIFVEKYGLHYERDEYGELSTQYLLWVWDYIYLYSIFTNKPELMTLRTKSVAVEYEEGKKVKHRKNNKRNKVKIVKYIDINSEDVDRLSEHSKREITCPAWGVAGHYRTYKSGKKIWIAPYKKGKYRDNPDMYKPKDYESQG